jgi:hypothetical protein
MKFSTLSLGVVMMLCVHAASADTGSNYGKGYAGVETRVVSSVRGAPGQSIDVRVDYISSSSDPVDVAYAAEGDLTLKSAARKQLNPDGQGVMHDTVVVQANSAGAYFLNVFVKTRLGSNAISIPVMVGTTIRKPQAASSVPAGDGQRVIEMPAQQIMR